MTQVKIDIGKLDATAIAALYEAQATAVSADTEGKE